MPLSKSAREHFETVVGKDVMKNTFAFCDDVEALYSEQNGGCYICWINSQIYSYEEYLEALMTLNNIKTSLRRYFNYDAMLDDLSTGDIMIVEWDESEYKWKMAENYNDDGYSPFVKIIELHKIPLANS